MPSPNNNLPPVDKEHGYFISPIGSSSGASLPAEFRKQDERIEEKGTSTKDVRPEVPSIFSELRITRPNIFNS